MTADRAALEVCGGCDHTAREHVQGIGCSVGWRYDIAGIAVNDGCLCQWSHVDSMTESEWKAS